jgi:hypothetical protein
MPFHLSPACLAGVGAGPWTASDFLIGCAEFFVNKKTPGGGFGTAAGAVPSPLCAMAERYAVHNSIAIGLPSRAQPRNYSDFRLVYVSYLFASVRDSAGPDGDVPIRHSGVPIGDQAPTGVQNGK